MNTYFTALDKIKLPYLFIQTHILWHYTHIRSPVKVMQNKIINYTHEIISVHVYIAAKFQKDSLMRFQFIIWN